MKRIHRGGRGAAFVALVVAMVVAAGAGPAAASVDRVDEPTGEAIRTWVVARWNGEPVYGVCVFAVPVVGPFVIPEVCPARSSGGGRVIVPVPGAGQYNLFALPDVGSRFGAQWVGPSRGTGSQKSARRINVAAGQTKSAPTIILDRPGTIIGRFPAEQHGWVGIAAADPQSAQPPRSQPINPDGTVVISGLGPYEWPVHVAIDGYPPQWSGQKAHRLVAELIPVPRQSPTHHLFYAIDGVPVTVRIADEPPVLSGRLVFRNGRTGEAVGVAEIGPDSQASTVILSGQNIRMQCLCGDTVRWDGGTDFDSATPYLVPHNRSQSWVFRSPTTPG